MVARYTASVPLVPGADAVVRELARSWPLGLASASPPQLIEAALTASGLADTFAVSLSADGVPRGKPAPDIYLAVAERLGHDPATCVAVEDSSNGLRATVAAGMAVIAVPNPHYPPSGDALALAAATVDVVGAVTPELVESLARR